MGMGEHSPSKSLDSYFYISLKDKSLRA